MDSPSRSLSIASSLESLVLESDENVTPCKNKNQEKAAFEVSSSRRKSTSLNTIKNLPPLKAPIDENVSDSSCIVNTYSPSSGGKSKQAAAVKDQPKPKWDESFVKKEFTPSRIPWSSDLRLRYVAKYLFRVVHVCSWF
jgi:hypothetical protein